SPGAGTYREGHGHPRRTPCRARPAPRAHAVVTALLGAVAIPRGGDPGDGARAIRPAHPGTHRRALVGSMARPRGAGLAGVVRRDLPAGPGADAGPPAPAADDYGDRHPAAADDPGPADRAGLCRGGPLA